MKYEANAGPPKGDHPIDRAINALPLPQYPIAPPVAAGSVDSIDTNEFCDLMTELQDVHQRLGNCKPNWDALIAHIHAWGEQQREAGQHEGALVSLNNYDAACDEYRKQIAALTGRAEKAEARIDELEAQLAAAKPYDLKA